MKGLDFSRMLLFIVGLVLVMLLSVGGAWAQLPTDVDNVSLALTYDQVVDDTGWGFLGAAPLKAGPVDGHVSAIFQGGDVIRGKYHIEGVLPVGPLGVKLFGDGGTRGDSWSTLGKQIDFGSALQTPDIEISGADVNVGVGVFARNSGAFGRLNARDALEAQGFDPNQLDDLGLEGIKLPKRGLSFPAGNSLQFLGYVTASQGDVSGSLKIVQQLTGKDKKTQQAIGSLYISRDIGEHLAVELGGEAGFQRYQKKWESEYALLSAVAFNY